MARRDRPHRPNVTGRSNKAPRFIGIPHRVWMSEAVCSLNPNARTLLIELAMMENGKNNGSIWLSVRDATDRIGFADFRPALQAFEDLIGAGLIAMTKDAHFSIKAAETSRARCWRLTWLAWPEGPKTKRAPSHEWETYLAPGQTPARKRASRRQEALARYRKALVEQKMPVVESTTMEVEMPINEVHPVGESTTAFVIKDANQPFADVGESTAHTAVTMGYGASMWWTSESISRMVLNQALFLLLAHWGSFRAAA
jgi:hypothetical protein